MSKKDFVNEEDLKDLPVAGETCPLCGEKLGDDKNFCHSCGKFLGNLDKTYKPMPDEKAKKIRLIVGVIAVAVFLIAYLLINK